MARKRFEISCLYCKKQYSTTKKETKFCSRSCGSKWNHKNNKNFEKTLNNLKQTKKGINVVCEFCNEQYYIPQNRIVRSRFCSAKCKSSWIYSKNKNKMIDNARVVNFGHHSGFFGKKHTQEALNKIMDASNNNTSGMHGIKYKKYIDKNKRELNLKSSYEIVFVENFLDLNDYEWYYEQERFKLSTGKIYIPDFYVKELDKWFEVKGYYKNGFIEKFNLFKVEYPNINIELVNIESMKNYVCNFYKKTTEAKKLWRKDDREDKVINNRRHAVDITSGFREKSLKKIPNMLETPKALNTIKYSENFKDETMDNQQGQQNNILKPSETTKGRP